ncbi:MAG: hypothetical protein AAF827_01215 [Cyanobacteria bacterium P01_D01_bin.6]
MDASRLGVSCCQRCRYFTLAGRRGGHCGQLNVSVRGNWSACSLAAPVFVESVDVDPMNTETKPQLAVWPQGVVLNHPDFEQLDSDYLQESA